MKKFLYTTSIYFLTVFVTTTPASLISSPSVSSTTLTAPVKELVTKQAISNIRYFSTQKNITYFQNSNGELLFETKLKIEKLLKNKSGTSYFIIDSNDFVGQQTIEPRDNSEIIAISQRDDFNGMFNIRYPSKIYLSKIASTKVEKVADGINPQLHLNGRWLSFFIPYDNVLKFVDTNNFKSSFKITLQNSSNPYFLPKVIMLSSSEIFYTNVNSKGEHGVFFFDRTKTTNNSVEKNKITSNQTLLYKGMSNQKLEICRLNSFLAIGKFGIGEQQDRSIIDIIPLATFNDKKFNVEENIKQLKNIYKSYYNDIGNMICLNKTNEIIFLKTDILSTGHVKQLVASLDVNTGAQVTLFDESNVFNLLLIDNKIISIANNTAYIVKEINPIEKKDLSQ